MPTYSLTDDEVLLLDGKVGAEVQGKIDFIKSSRLVHPNSIVGKAITESISKGTFVCRTTSMHRCPVCQKDAGYGTHKRSSRNAFGPRKGAIDYSKPLTMAGYEVNPGFITIRNTGDFCEDCNQQGKLVETIKSEILSKSLPIEIVGDKSTKFKLDKQQRCYACKDLMFESEMGKAMTLMCDGYYPSECPKCKAKSEIFGAKHEHLNTFRMLPVKEKV